MRWIAGALAVVMCAASVALGQTSAQTQGQKRAYAGFDRNFYPGDAALPELKKHFDFVGFWVTPPPLETTNTWAGKRGALMKAGFGFVVVANGRLDKEITRSAKAGKPAAALAKADATTVVAAAKREGFPTGTIIFLDQEEGGVLLPEQAAYLLAWTEAVAASTYKPGVYASGEPVPNGKGPDGKPATITTIEDIKERVKAQHLHEIAFWVAYDKCPPAPGCVVDPPPAVELSGVMDAIVWQYSQSDGLSRRKVHQACEKTYDKDGNCYSPAPARLDVDFSSATTPDPSHGR